MTVENAQFRLFMVNMRRITGLGAAECSSLPDADHLASGGYHVGCEDIQRVGRWNTDYSTRQARDRLDGTNDSSAFDVGDDWPRGGRAAWLRWNNLFLNGLLIGDPALAAVRAINVSRDGIERKRYDTLHPEMGLIPSTDGVTYHTHGETWRDQRGRVALDRAFRRLEQMADAAVRNIPLPPEGGPFMALTAEQQKDMWEWLALLVDPDTPATGRPTDRFHFPPPFLDVNAKLDAILNALAAIVAAGGSADAAAILAGVKAEIRDAVADLGEGGAAQVRADE